MVALRHLLLVLSLAGLSAAWLQGGEILTNQDVIALIEATVDAELIKKKISACDNDFDVSAAAMVVLRKGGVPDEIIKAMLSAVEKQESRSSNRISLQLQYLTSDRPETRHSAYLKLMSMGGSARRSMMEVLSSNQDPHRRAAVARALGRMGAKEAVSILRLLLEDPGAEVRLAAGDALYQLDEAESVRSSWKIVDSWQPYDKELKIDGHIRLLGLARHAEAVSKFTQVLEQCEDAPTRAEAIGALGRLTHEGSRELFERLLKGDSSLVIRQASAEALALLRKPESIEVLTAVALTDTENRSAIYRALSYFPPEKTVPFLISQLKDGMGEAESKPLLDALRTLTHQTFGVDKIAWLTWWEKNEQELAVKSLIAQ